jgi:hypothetical protein
MRQNALTDEVKGMVKRRAFKATESEKRMLTDCVETTCGGKEVCALLTKI